MLQKKILVQHALAVDQNADVLKKPISSSNFRLLRHKLRVEDLQTLNLRGTIEKRKLLCITDFVISE